MAKTINWINLVRAICIISVFLVHCENYYGCWIAIINPMVHPFYVNAFFFVSGYLLFWKQLTEPKISEGTAEYLIGGGKKHIINILYRIVFPSVLFALIEYFPKKLIDSGGITLRSLIYETIGGCTYWFTSALVVAEIIFVLLLLTRRRNVWFYFIFAILFTCLGDYLATYKLDIVSDSAAFPWQYKQGLICMVYVAAGGVYWRYENLIHRLVKKNWLLLLIIGAYCALTFCFNSYLAKGYLVSMCQTHPAGVAFGIFASLLLVELCKKLPEVRPLTFVGQNSIGFYFMSGALPIVVSAVAHKVFHATSPILLIAVWLVCISVAYIAVYLIKRWLPWMFDLRFLKKKI